MPIIVICRHGTKGHKFCNWVTQDGYCGADTKQCEFQIIGQYEGIE